jgi:hypothetical protein
MRKNKITQKVATPCHQQKNGQVEVLNWDIKTIVENIVNLDSKD